jgi:hypothetical protein
MRARQAVRVFREAFPAVGQTHPERDSSLASAKKRVRLSEHRLATFRADL